MKYSRISILILCLCFNGCKRQSSTFAPYLGETPPGQVPQLFAPGVISTPDHEHSPLIFSPDGREIIWSVIPVPLGSGKQDMFHLYFEQDKWTPPIRIPFSVAHRCGSPTLSPDGKYLYYLERDPDGDENVRPGSQIVWRIERTGDHGWSERERITDMLPSIEGRVTMRFGFADNGNLYYDLGGPREDELWDWDIWMREFQNGVYGEPRKLGHGINDGIINWTPFIARDESYLIWSTNRMDNGDYGDHFISFKDEDGRWSTPISMGETINTPRQERFPVVSPDGMYFFFTRNMPENYSEYFWVDAEVIAALRADVLSFQ